MSAGIISGLMAKI